MAKPQKAAPRTRTWTPKTKTPKRMRKGINAAAHLSCPVIRLQTHGFDVVKDKKVPRIANFKRPYVPANVMREAFESAQLPADGARDPLVKRIIRVMRRSRTRAGASGWKVSNRRGKRGKRSR